MTPPDRRDRDLELIDAALLKDRVTATESGERELQAIALAVRAEAPEPSAAFEAEMDARMAERFARKRRFALALPGGWFPRLATAAAIAAAIVLAIVLTNGGGTHQGTEAARSTPSTSSTLTARRVERSAQLTLSAPGDRLQDIANSAATAATRHGGFVLSSNVTTGAGAGGQLELQVPTGQLEATVSDIARLGHVRTRNESGQDMTQPFELVKTRLGVDLAERITLRASLRNAHGSRATTIRTQLRTLSGEIQSLSSRMESLRRRTTLALISVTLQVER